MSAYSNTTVGIVDIAGALAGATLAGSYLTGAPMMDVATSVSGGAGAAIGYGVGLWVAPKLTASYSSLASIQPVIPLAFAIAVPGLASGTWNTTTIALGAGAFAGCYVAGMILGKMGSTGGGK